ncbi:hypothetical protein BST95_07650 [Halioglobus japonicus]|uniref:diguanylate cyclase n=2 Tax=Halioglobus japonicus TaxID=930805 RepID=A0AAP8SN02_9GAMM|nr:hypothetical protein BST95_07650 [Halioglobus japonicus]PLW86130.1 GGDEF domain-containing protein [Halioglobus japonicus]GHD14323.1 hypothetical protein GCM10007052_17930 [Halioglobus japonicus]
MAIKYRSCILTILCLLSAMNTSGNELSAEINLLADQNSLAVFETNLDSRNLNPIGLAEGYALIGARWEAFERHENAHASYSRSVSLLEPFGASPELIQALIDRSYMQYLLTGSTEDYCPDREQAVGLARQLDTAEPLVRALVHRAFCFHDQGEMQQGLGDAQEAMAIATEYQLSSDLKGMVANATGNLYRSALLPDLAYEAYAQAYQHWQKRDDRPDIFNMLHNMTGEALKLGLWEAAEAHINEMFNMADQPGAGRDFLFFAFYNRGLMAMERYQFMEAATALDNALALKKTTSELRFVALAYHLRATQHLWGGEPDKALADLARARASGLIEEDKLMPLEDLAIALNAVENPLALTNPFELLLRQVREQQRKFRNEYARADYAQHMQLTAEYEAELLERQLQVQALELAQAQSAAELARQGTLNATLLIVLLCVLLLILVKSWRSQKRRSNTDYLSGIANRERLFELGFRAARTASKQGQPVAVILLDIDHFKSINDSHGHAVGDRAIALTAQTIEELCRHRALAGRLGGEEFLVILPGSTLEHACLQAETMRKAIAGLEIRGSQERKLSFTVSAGVAIGSGEQIDFEGLVHDADVALYRAKSAGRNRTKAFQDMGEGTMHPTPVTRSTTRDLPASDAHTKATENG